MAEAALQPQIFLATQGENLKILAADGQILVEICGKEILAWNIPLVAPWAVTMKDLVTYLRNYSRPWHPCLKFEEFETGPVPAHLTKQHAGWDLALLANSEKIGASLAEFATLAAAAKDTEHNHISGRFSRHLWAYFPQGGATAFTLYDEEGNAVTDVRLPSSAPDSAFREGVWLNSPAAWVNFCFFNTLRVVAGKVFSSQQELVFESNLPNALKSMNFTGGKWRPVVGINSKEAAEQAAAKAAARRVQLRRCAFAIDILGVTALVLLQLNS